ncbi:hypothetical protein QBC39DRAFT_251846 [Podospora conica]|nr:hypothetical protein QBC39DRAFT_251846 [Schizothecium conicum]
MVHVSDEKQTASKPEPTNKTEPQKRRACDECRTKKLACSKELDGCGRCKKEGIKCVYSVQKTMGRPRKRAHHEVNGAEPAPEPAPEPLAHVQVPEHDAHDIVGIFPPFDNTLNLELDLSFLDFDNPNLNFFELIEDPNFPPLPDLDGPPAPKKPNTALEAPIISTAPHGTPDPTSNVWLSDFLSNDINFDLPTDPPPYPDLPDAISREDIESIMAADIPSPLPSLSPATSHTSPSTTTSSPPSLPPAPCACLLTLYLALDSLQRLPTEVGAAMKVARTAARQAQACIACPTCGDPPLDASMHKPAIGPFQTLMMLGALLPSLSHAYMRILSMVDEATFSATAERRRIHFAIDDYGGLSGGMMDRCREQGGAALMREPLEPMMWRLLVRALLKIDVYGMHEASAGVDIGAAGRGVDLAAAAAGGCSQPGLKDIIATVEERSRRRHEQLDMALAMGLVEKPADCEYDIGAEPPCMKIINIAKKSMRELIIP